MIPIKIIYNRLIYDTDRASAIAEWTNGQHMGDPAYLEQTLFRTKNGRWFLYEEGGPESSVARDGGQTMRPLPDDMALEWLARVNVDLCIAHFGDLLQDA